MYEEGTAIRWPANGRRACDETINLAQTFKNILKKFQKPLENRQNSMHHTHKFQTVGNTHLNVEKCAIACTQCVASAARRAWFVVEDTASTRPGVYREGRVYSLVRTD